MGSKKYVNHKLFSIVFRSRERVKNCSKLFHDGGTNMQGSSKFAGFFR